MLDLTIIYNLSQIGQIQSLKLGGDGKQRQAVSGQITPDQVTEMTDIGLKIGLDGKIDNAGYKEWVHFSESSIPKDGEIESCEKNSNTAISWKPITFDAPQTFQSLLGFYAEIKRSQNRQRAALAVKIKNKIDKDYKKMVDRGNTVIDKFFTDTEARSSINQYTHSVTLYDIYLEHKHPRFTEFRVEAIRRNELDAKAKKEAEAAREAKKQQQIVSWVTTNGTDSQKERLAAGLLPRDEVVGDIKADAFSAADGISLYESIQKCDIPHKKGCYLDYDDSWGMNCVVESTQSVDAYTWSKLKEVRKIFPDAVECIVKKHICSCPDCDNKVARLGIYVKLQVGEFTFNREFAV